MAISDEGYEADCNYMTVVFKMDARGIGPNPFDIDTPFGKPIAVGIGNAFDEIESMADFSPIASAIRERGKSGAGG